MTGVGVAVDPDEAGLLAVELVADVSAERDPDEVEVAAVESVVADCVVGFVTAATVVVPPLL